VLSTDYDNFLITIQCFENAKAAKQLGRAVEHIFKIRIYTTDPVEEDYYFKWLIDHAVAKVPGLDAKTFGPIF
jgi:hypothetical protein